MTERRELIKLLDFSEAKFCDGCRECPERRGHSLETLADLLIEKGYREEAKGAEEIFEELLTFIIDYTFMSIGDVAKIYRKVIEMKKAYREKRNEET